jgi:hypothetical protein
MTGKETQASDGVASVLNAELDVEDGLMCVWFDNTEISHLLGSHINDQGNMEDWQDSACVKGAETIDRLRAEVKRLRKSNSELLDAIKVIEKEATYIFTETFGECRHAENIIGIASDIANLENI